MIIPMIIFDLFNFVFSDKGQLLLLVKVMTSFFNLFHL